MGVVVKKVDLTWLDRTYLWPVAKGLFITLKHFLRQILTTTKKRQTVQYPEMKRPVSDGYRGLHELKRHEDNSIKCVACFMCAEACPARCITIDAEEFGDLNTLQGIAEKRPVLFQIDMLRCIFCGMCQEACPKDAIWLRKNYELSCKSRDEMQLGKFDLMNTYAEEDGSERVVPESMFKTSNNQLS
ncbi:MAG: NADH-quinone oxidoreductase subunit I [Holophagales bacterium]|jgi:NADH-quinone oxidoreductase subunit I|nr:NADH-quinone oxidoreductase subunit I [Holophagales bacterium]